MHRQPQDSWIVIKLGGTSVSGVACWEKAANEIRGMLHAGKRVLVVQSALAGITDQLDALLRCPGETERRVALADIATRHHALAAEMDVSFERIRSRLERLEQQALGAALTGEVTPRLRAEVLATGELMASELAFAWLEQAGLDIHWQDVRELLRASAAGSEARHYLNATCDT